MSNPVRTTDQSSFEQDVIKAKGPVLVDFYADWCGPCKAIAPVVEDLAAHYDGKVEFKKVDVDSNPELARDLGVRGIPTLVLFKEGQAVETVVGATSKASLVNLIDQQLS